MHSHIAVGTGALLSREVFSFVLSRANSLDQRVAAFPDMLMCTLLAVLMCTQTLFALGMSWPHAVPPAASFAQTWGVQHTLRYVEWMVSVPLLLVIAGHVGLGRPLKELRRSIFVTNAYIMLACVAMLVPDALTRWILIVFSFALYLLASLDMVMWTSRFRDEVPKDIPARRQRVFLVQFLVLVFGLYGLNYLMAAVGAINNHSEHLVYNTFDIIAKVITVGILCFVRTAENRDTLGEMILKHSSLNTSFVSLLRADFDHVLPCTIDSDGSCWIPEDITSDGHILESILNRSLSGARFSDLIADEEEKTKFKDYVQKSLDKVQKECQMDLADAQRFWKRKPSVLASRPGDAQLVICDLDCGNTEGVATCLVRVVVHVVAAVPPGLRSSGAECETVLTVRILSEPVLADSAHVRVHSSEGDDVTHMAQSHNHELNVTSLEHDFDWDMALSNSPSSAPASPSVGSEEPCLFRQSVSCDEASRSERSWKGAGSGSPQSRPLNHTGSRAASSRRAPARASSSCSRMAPIKESPLSGSLDHKLNGIFKGLLRSCSMRTEPGPFDGVWVLVDDGRSSDLSESSWLNALQIQGMEVIDGNGQPCLLSTESRGTLLSGGVLRLSDDGDVLIRTGKSGNSLHFERVFGGKHMHAKRTDTTWASQESNGQRFESE